MAMIIISHDLGVVAGVADRVMIMYARPGGRDRTGCARCTSRPGTRTPAA